MIITFLKKSNNLSGQVVRTKIIYYLSLSLSLLSGQNFLASSSRICPDHLSGQKCTLSGEV